MTDNDRFGLPLSLVEALRTDSSPAATALVDLLMESEPASKVPAAVGRRTKSYRSMALTGVALALSMGMQGEAAAESVGGGQTLEGRWTMAAPQSSFQERVTGAAPDAAVMIVTRDSRDHLAYELSETRQGVEVAHGAYDISLDGAQSVSRVDGVKLGVTANRDGRGDVVIQAPSVGAYRAVIHVHRTGPDSLLLEHDVEGAGQSMTLEQIHLVRAEPATAGSKAWAQAAETAQ